MTPEDFVTQMQRLADTHRIKEADALFRAQWPRLEELMTGRLRVELASIMEYVDTLLDYEPGAQAMSPDSDGSLTDAPATAIVR